MFTHFEAESDLNPVQAMESLASKVSRGQWFSRPKTPFVGSVSGERFRITRVVGGRDSFNPMIYGRIKDSPNGSCVRVVMAIHPIVLVLMIAWSIGLISSAIIYGDHRFFIWVFVAAPWIIGIPTFYYDAARSRALLRESLRLREKA